MNYDNILTDKKLLRYFKKRHLEKHTQNLYFSAFKAYYQSTNLTPADNLLKQRIAIVDRLEYLDSIGKAIVTGKQIGRAHV